ncbi:MAG: CBS domain-containing protein [Deltaproteobacteria bacterium]|nr:CBS domain-containing protein [Deltaproteobacteria bacterium]
MTSVADLMTTDLVTLSEEDGLGRAMTIFTELPIRHLPVTDGAVLIGMVSQRDALSWSGSVIDPGAFSRSQASKEARETFVAEVMIRDVVSVPPTATVVEAARAILEGGFGCLPVVDEDDNLIGIVTETDLLRHLVSGELTSDQGARAPAAVRPLE